MAGNQSSSMLRQVQCLFTKVVSALSILAVGSGDCVWVASAAAPADKVVVGSRAIQDGPTNSAKAPNPQAKAPLSAPG